MLGDLFGALPEVVLLPGELFERSLHLVGAHLGALPGQFLLLLQQLVLAARQLLDLVDRSRLLLPAFGRAVARLVVGLLSARQFLVKQTRQILRGPIAATALPRLLTLDLALFHIGLRAQQMVERFHLRRHRVSGLQRIEFDDRVAHCCRGCPHGVFLRECLHCARCPRGAARLDARLSAGLCPSSP